MTTSRTWILFCIFLLLGALNSYVNAERTCGLIGVGTCSPVKDLCKSNSDCPAGKICCPDFPQTCGNACVDGIDLPSMDEMLLLLQENQGGR